MRIAVVGAGAMGSLFAAKLKLSGDDVTLIDVDLHRLAELEIHGVQMVVAGQKFQAHVPTTAPALLTATYDILLLLTKFSSLPAALRGSSGALRSRGCVAVFSNGLGVADMLADECGDASLAIGVTDIAADLRDGIVHSDGTGRVVAGLAGTTAKDITFDTLCDRLAAAGFTLEKRHPIASAVWEKAAFNAAFNALATITGLKVGGLDNPSGRYIVEAVLQEVAVVAQQEGIILDTAKVSKRIDAAFRYQAHHLPSMLQDRRAGRLTEIETLNGEIARRAEAAGLTAIVNRTLTELVRLTGG